MTKQCAHFCFSPSDCLSFFTLNVIIGNELLDPFFFPLLSYNGPIMIFCGNVSSVDAAEAIHLNVIVTADINAAAGFARFEPENPRYSLRNAGATPRFHPFFDQLVIFQVLKRPS